MSAKPIIKRRAKKWGIVVVLIAATCALVSYQTLPSANAQDNRAGRNTGQRNQLQQRRGPAPRQHFKSGGERSEAILAEILTTLKQMDARLESIERAAQQWPKNHATNPPGTTFTPPQR